MYNYSPVYLQLIATLLLWTVIIISLNYSSTLEDSLLTFQCKDGLLPDDVFTARCYRNGSWIPNPSGHVCATSSAGVKHLIMCLLYYSPFQFIIVNCGDPLPPSNGFIEPCTSTVEGARVTTVHQCKNGERVSDELVCHSDGEWETINDKCLFGK